MILKCYFSKMSESSLKMSHSKFPPKLHTRTYTDHVGLLSVKQQQWISYASQVWVNVSVFVYWKHKVHMKCLNNSRQIETFFRLTEWERENWCELISILCKVDLKIPPPLPTLTPYQAQLSAIDIVPYNARKFAIDILAKIIKLQYRIVIVTMIYERVIQHFINIV